MQQCERIAFLHTQSSAFKKVQKYDVRKCAAPPHPKDSGFALFFLSTGHAPGFRLSSV